MHTCFISRNAHLIYQTNVGALEFNKGTKDHSIKSRIKWSLQEDLPNWFLNKQPVFHIYVPLGYRIGKPLLSSH